MDNEIVYFELNNWFPGYHYPDAEPYRTWIGNDATIIFFDESWVKKNKLCVVLEIIDQSCDFCITATKEWIENNCPTLLNEYKKFLRFPNDDGDVYDQFGTKFLHYEVDNIGLNRVDWDEE